VRPGRTFARLTRPDKAMRAADVENVGVDLIAGHQNLRLFCDLSRSPSAHWVGRGRLVSAAAHDATGTYALTHLFFSEIRKGVLTAGPNPSGSPVPPAAHFRARSSSFKSLRTSVKCSGSRSRTVRIRFRSSSRLAVIANRSVIWSRERWLHAADRRSWRKCSSGPTAKINERCSWNQSPEQTPRPVHRTFGVLLRTLELLLSFTTGHR
jgi:hypothetical protein